MMFKMRWVPVLLTVMLLLPALAWADDTETLHSADGQYQLVLPKNWESKDFHLSTVQIGAINKKRGEYAEVIAENPQDYTDSLNQYADAKRDTMAMSLDNPTLTVSAQGKVNGDDAVRFELHGQLPNTSVKIGYVVTIIKTKTHYIQVIGWTQEEHFSDDLAELAGLANGFSETAAATK